jgi:hypothetical protein
VLFARLYTLYASNHAALQSHSNPILELGGVQRGDASAPLLATRAVSERRLQQLQAAVCT